MVHLKINRIFIELVLIVQIVHLTKCDYVVEVSKESEETIEDIDDDYEIIDTHKRLSHFKDLKGKYSNATFNQSRSTTDTIKLMQQIMLTNHPFLQKPLGSRNQDNKIFRDDDFDTDKVEVRYFHHQLIDHNDPTAGTFTQRYYVYWEFCRPYLQQGIHSNRPQVFGFFGQEVPGDISDLSIYGFCVDLAKKYGCCCVELEHRQFGESIVTRDASVKNMEFLRADQVLGNMARFVNYFNKKYNIQYKKWGFYGCSLTGNYVARFAVKYSHLYEFGIAASASLKIYYDFHQYYDTCGDVIGEINPQCRSIISDAFATVTSMVKEVRSGYCDKLHPYQHCSLVKNYTKILQKYFQICNDIDLYDETTVQEMILYGTNYLTILVQYDNLLSVTVKDFCDYLVKLPSENLNPFDSLRKLYLANCYLFKRFYGYPVEPSDPDFVSCDKFCLFSINYKADLEYYRQTDWEAESNALGYRQWSWIVCQYFINFFTTTGRNSAFGGVLTPYIYSTFCKDFFENRFNFKAERLAASEYNALHGGRKGIPGSCSSCTLYVTHGRDPWKGGQMLTPHDMTCGGFENKFVLYKYGSHCSTAYPNSWDDPNNEPLKIAKKQIYDAVDHWMTEGCKHRTRVHCPR